MIHYKKERGQALILIALAAVGLFAFSALAIDGSRQFSNKRNAQNAADTAALSAALKHVRTGGDLAQVKTAAENAAQANGYLTDWGDTIVDFDVCNNVIDINPVTGLPVPGDVKVDGAGQLMKDGSGNYIPEPCAGISGPAKEYLRVKIITTIPATFGRVIGRDKLTSAAQAVTRVQGSSSTSSLPDDALVALIKENGCGICGGSTALDLEVKNSGIFSNSSDSCTSPEHGSMDFDDGHPVITSAGGFTMPAGAELCMKPPPFSGITGPVNPAAPQIESLDFGIPAPNITCSGSYTDEGAAVKTETSPGSGVYIYTYPPGNYSNAVTVDDTGTHVFNGNYCLANGITFKGAINVQFTQANFRVDGRAFDFGGGSGVVNLTCSEPIMVHVLPGSKELTFNGNGNITCNGITFYVEDNDIKWNGNSVQLFAAPTSGPYKGLLIYLPPAGTKHTVTINGNSTSNITGSIIAPTAEVALKGNSYASGYKTQIISYQLSFEGGSTTIIDYDPSVIYVPPANPTIKLDQ